MTSISREYVCFVRTAEVAAWMAYREEDQLWHTETFARGRCGLYYLEGTYEGDQPEPATLIRQARIYGVFSPRPVRLDRAIDPSMTSGVLTMFVHWCLVHWVDPRTLIRQAYAGQPPYALQSLSRIVSQALWEGVLYPPQWSALACRELGHALVDVGYEELAAVFAQALESAS